MNFFSAFSSSSSSKPTARTRQQQPPIDVTAPHPIPTWPSYYHTHLTPTPPPPHPSTQQLLITHLPHHPYPPPPSAAINRLVKLWQGDITRLGVGAVVNAANGGMWAGGGICGAIHSAAGRELEVECERWVAAHGDVATGETLVTKAYRLPAQYVFHTVGPKDGSWEKLSRCYRSCLDLLLQHQCRSIAFCCISTGIFGFPNLEAALCALSTVRQWLDEDERHRQAVDAILFCVFLDKDKDIYERHMPLFFPLTQDELEGKAGEGVVGGDGEGEGEGDGEGKVGVEGEGVEEDGGESKKQRVEQQSDSSQQSGDMMEVNRGDTVWVRSDNSAADQPAQPPSTDQAADEAALEHDQPRSAQEEDEHKKRLTASILARNIQFSRAPPPSTDAPHHPHHNRRPSVLFFSSTSALTPHVACLLTNSQHGAHIQARWTTSHKDGPLVDETAAAVMEEMHIDESDDRITHYREVPGMLAGGQVDCVVAVDGVAKQQADELVGGSGGRVVVLCHEVADPQQGQQVGGGGERDVAHLQVRYRQSFNEVKAFVNDLPSVLERVL